MKKVNIKNELNYLEEKNISRSWLGKSDGSAIKKADMSQYTKECYNKSTVIELHKEIPLTYKYHYDKKNRACILFTGSVIQDSSDQGKTIFETYTIIVKIYTSERGFYSGTLAKHIFYSVFEQNKNYWDLSDQYYKTDCVKFNEFPFIQDIRKL
jgi:hypothetical protein